MPVRELCKRRLISCYDVATPILVPAFSSKGFPTLRTIWDNVRQQIVEVALVSSYDLYYGNIGPEINAPTLLFVDSGGYEARKDFDLSEVYADYHESSIWSRDLHLQGIRRLKTSASLVLISFDDLANDNDFHTQIQLAKDFFSGFPEVATCFLAKPSYSDILTVDEFENHIHELSTFDILGVTEKELGTSLEARLANVVKLRQALTSCGVEIPIHIFGCLDPLSVWLFFLCGADIFDGLSWLRFAFYQNQAIYRNSWAILNRHTDLSNGDLALMVWLQNLRYLGTQRLQMIRFTQEIRLSEIPIDEELLTSVLDFIGLNITEE
jgi:hypothetical protein